MKRDPALIPLSRDHHQMLLLARLIRNDAPPYQGLPREATEKLQYARDFYRDFILHHFEKEEQLFRWVEGQGNEALIQLVTDLRNDHTGLKQDFENLSQETMDRVGRSLEKHIRKEERVFFQQLQAQLDLTSLAK
jgi:iron-sulfur cluster repair protein YtfE (RIC family)